MSRTADYTIQGFLYQFNKTLLEILNSPDDAVVTVEGIVEDIDISTPSMMKAIQCKYHETQKKFTPSIIYKPLLEMMHHFYQNSDKNITYILFAYFPSQYGRDTLPVDKQTLEEALKSKNPDFAKHINVLKGNVDLDAFLEKFSAPVGSSFDTLIQEVYEALQTNEFSKEDIETLIYPNAIHMIASLSVKHDLNARKTDKKKLIESLRNVRKVAISRWTLALKTREQILNAKRKELKLDFDKNTRRRCFIIYADSLNEDDCISEIVMFVKDYCDKYHFKPTHTEPPLFCIKTEEEKFKDIQSRLYQKRVLPTDGYVGSDFFKEHFLRKFKYHARDSDFSIRFLRWEHVKIITEHNIDDLFILGSDTYNDWNLQDVNIEILDSQSLKEIKYMCGISHVYE